MFPYKPQALLKNTDKFKLLTVMKLQIQTEVSQSHEVRQQPHVLKSVFVLIKAILSITAVFSCILRNTEKKHTTSQFTALELYNQP